MIINYSNLTALMKRHKVTAGEIAKVINKTYPPVMNKLNINTTKQGEVSVYDIVEAKQIADYLLQKEKDFLKEKFGQEWESEWQKRWGHITNWFNYLFFDEVVSNATASNF